MDYIICCEREQRIEYALCSCTPPLLDGWLSANEWIAYFVWWAFGGFFLFIWIIIPTAYRHFAKSHIGYGVTLSLPCLGSCMYLHTRKRVSALSLPRPCMLKFIHVLCNRLCASSSLKFNSIIHLIYHFPCLQADLSDFHSDFYRLLSIHSVCVCATNIYSPYQWVCVCAHIREHYLYLDNYVISAIFGKFAIQIGHFPCTMQPKTWHSVYMLKSV